MGIVSAAVAIIVVLLELKPQVTAWFPLRREIKAIKKIFYSVKCFWFL